MLKPSELHPMPRKTVLVPGLSKTKINSWRERVILEVAQSAQLFFLNLKCATFRIGGIAWFSGHRTEPVNNRAPEGEIRIRKLSSERPFLAFTSMPLSNVASNTRLFCCYMGPRSLMHVDILCYYVTCMRTIAVTPTAMCSLRYQTLAWPNR